MDFPSCFVCSYFDTVNLFTELLYNITADVDKRQKSQPARVYFTQSGSQINQMSQQISLDINREECRRYTAYVKVRFRSPGRVCAGLSVRRLMTSGELSAFT